MVVGWVVGSLLIIILCLIFYTRKLGICCHIRTDNWMFNLCFACGKYLCFIWLFVWCIIILLGIELLEKINFKVADSITIQSIKN